jgi:pimeloyl-ACP methyl ester carboxylesterase
MAADSSASTEPLWRELKRFRATHAEVSLVSLGHSWRYISSGKGDHALLIFEGSCAIAEAEFQRIFAFEPRCRVVSVSYPATASRMQDLVAGVAAILDSLGLRTAALLGHSLGGALAQCVVRSHPERVSHLLLANIAVAATPRVMGARVLSRLLPLLPEALIRAMLTAALRRNLIALAEPERDFYTDYFSELVHQSISKPLFINQCRCMLDFIENYHFSPDDLNAWRGKTLIIEAADDRGWNAAERAAVRALYPVAQVHTFDHGGHMVGTVLREEYDAVIDSFLGLERKPAK